MKISAQGWYPYLEPSTQKQRQQHHVTLIIGTLKVKVWPDLKFKILKWCKESKQAKVPRSDLTRCSAVVSALSGLKNIIHITQQKKEIL